MKTVGIIAEYNPFHNGHKYHINMAKKESGADCAVVLMSGNFVQRGEPSVADKYFRTECALKGGADLVIELPAAYATASAPVFAHGAVSLFNGLNNIDYLAFGIEGNDINPLKNIAEILSDEPDNYRVLLKKYILEGIGIPAARQKALFEYASSYEKGLLPYVSSLISSPNNILGIEYLKALHATCSDIVPIGIKRVGSGYHDTEINEGYPSATALRKLIEKGNFDEFISNCDESLHDIYLKEYGKKFPVMPDDISLMLQYALNTNKDILTEYSDWNKSMADKIIRILSRNEILSYSDIVEQMKSRELTYTRIQRALIHIILDIKTSFMNNLFDSNYPSYARILGFNGTGRIFLNNCRKSSEIPVIVNTADAFKMLSQKQYALFRKDLDASAVYRLIINSKYGSTINDDYRSKPVILE